MEQSLRSTISLIQIQPVSNLYHRVCWKFIHLDFFLHGATKTTQHLFVFLHVLSTKVCEFSVGASFFFCCLLSRGGAVELVCVVGQARWELFSCPSAAHIVASGSNYMQNKPLNRASSHAKLIKLVFTDR